MCTGSHWIRQDLNDDSAGVKIFLLVKTVKVESVRHLEAKGKSRTVISNFDSPSASAISSLQTCEIDAERCRDPGQARLTIGPEGNERVRETTPRVRCCVQGAQSGFRSKVMNGGRTSAV